MKRKESMINGLVCIHYWFNVIIGSWNFNDTKKLTYLNYLIEFGWVLWENLHVLSVLVFSERFLFFLPINLTYNISVWYKNSRYELFFLVFIDLKVYFSSQIMLIVQFSMFSDQFSWFIKIYMQKWPYIWQFRPFIINCDHSFIISDHMLLITTIRVSSPTTFFQRRPLV